MMAGKKRAVWQTQLTGLAVTAAVELIGCLLTALLAVRGVLPEERLTWALAAWVFCASLAGGLTAGRGRPMGALLNGALLGALLLLTGYGVWGSVSLHGPLLPSALAAGAVTAAVIQGKVGKRRGKRLVRFNKKAHFS